MGYRTRLRRAVVGFAIALVAVLPASALAGAPGGSDPGVEEQADRADRGGPGERGRSQDRATDSAETSDNAPSGSDAAAPGKSGEAPSGADAAPGKSDAAPGRADAAPGHSDGPRADAAPGRSEVGRARPDGRPPPEHTVRPDPHGPPGLAREVGAAIVMLDLPTDDDAFVLVTPAEPSGLSGDLATLLAPVMPPAFVEAVTSPIVVFEALLEAMASSGQALVIPFIAAGIGFFLPALRRRDVIAAVAGD